MEHETEKLLAPHTAPQAPQSSGQFAHVSFINVSHVPFPHVAAGVHAGHVVRMPKAQTCLSSPIGGCGINPVFGSGGLSDEMSRKTTNAPGTSGVVTESITVVPLLRVTLVAPPGSDAEKPPRDVSPRSMKTFQSARGPVDHPRMGIVVVLPGGSATQSEGGDAL
jgi:hypothetical protein